MYPTDKQLKALKKLKRALKECEKEKVLFHNCYGTLKAFNGNIVETVDDTAENGIYEFSYECQCFEISLPCSEWADDRHYVHLKKGEI